MGQPPSNDGADRREGDAPSLKMIGSTARDHSKSWRTMNLNLAQIGQIALPVADVDRSEAFYGEVLGLRKLFRFGDLTFFDRSGVRLMLEKAHGPEPPVRAD